MVCPDIEPNGISVRISVPAGAARYSKETPGLSISAASGIARRLKFCSGLAFASMFLYCQ
jgi:hypothetical protein